MLAEIVGISKRKVEENVAKLKKMGLVERVLGGEDLSGQSYYCHPHYFSKLYLTISI